MKTKTIVFKANGLIWFPLRSVLWEGLRMRKTGLTLIGPFQTHTAAVPDVV